MFTKLKHEASKYGLLINESKTKYMKRTRMQVRGNKLEIDTNTSSILSQLLTRTIQ
jgi:hypothetical protein